MRLFVIGFLCCAPLCSLLNGQQASQSSKREEADSLRACAQAVLKGFRKVALSRDLRFEGKVSEANAL